jgi:hypothetical protein
MDRKQRLQEKSLNIRRQLRHRSVKKIKVHGADRNAA